MSEDRTLADRFDIAGAAAIVVGALAIALLAVVIGLVAGLGSAEQLEQLADKLVTGLLALLASTRLSTTRAPEPPAEEPAEIVPRKR